VAETCLSSLLHLVKTTAEISSGVCQEKFRLSFRTKKRGNVQKFSRKRMRHQMHREWGNTLSRACRGTSFGVSPASADVCRWRAVSRVVIEELKSSMKELLRPEKLTTEDLFDVHHYRLTVDQCLPWERSSPLIQRSDDGGAKEPYCWKWQQRQT